MSNKLQSHMKEAQNITEEMLQNVFDNIRRRINLCWHQNEGHVTCFFDF